MAETPRAAAVKSEGAFRTIGELSAELGLAQHVLRYWETRFPQLRPLQRAGNRRYYRPQDVALARRINTLLNGEGYTVKGVQQLLTREREEGVVATAEPSAAPVTPAAPADKTAAEMTASLRAIRAALNEALAADGSR